MTTIILNKGKNLHPNKYKKGDIANISDKVAQRWIDKGIAHYAHNVIFTANIGKVNVVPTNQHDSPGFIFILFTDDPTAKSNLWNVRYVKPKFHDPRRNARMYKWLIHRFVNAEYSLWIDSNLIIHIDINRLIKKYLKDADIAIHRHGVRNCIYEEANVCSQKKLDYIKIIKSQMMRYKNDNYPENNGLWETKVVLRRHTKKIKKLNEAVWTEICNGSVRDQLCFNYVAWKLGIKVNALEGIFSNYNTKFKVTPKLRINKQYF